MNACNTMSFLTPSQVSFRGLGLLLLSFLSSFNLFAQEHTTSIQHASGKAVDIREGAHKPTLLGLPFFDDFTGESVHPNPDLWQNGESVYLSNTMPNGHFSRGTVVFDACNSNNVPYDTVDRNLLMLADTLTALPIDLSEYTPEDKLVLSFFYQGKGNGFFPKPGDSLLVYMLQENGQWRKVWEKGGDTFQNIRPAMVAITDTQFFHSQFQFRIQNKATIGLSNSNWIVDYVYLDTNRELLGYIINDVAFTRPAAPLLADFTAMPWRHFITDPGTFTASELTVHLRNNGVQNGTIPWGYTATEINSGTLLGSGNSSENFTIEEERELNLPMFNFSGFTPTDPDGKVEILSRYHCDGLYPDEPLENDTITQVQTFDNYLAYDDGSAEQSYFLTTYPNAPGETAIEFAAYVPDTLRGVSIYFAAQVPPATYKEFSLAVYRELSVNGGMDSIIYREDYFFPRYSGEVNIPVEYVFENPVLLPPGPFYISIVQPAGGFSDSLYIGLDRNRTGGNHRYYNVDGTWHSSQLEGALLVRPLLGAELSADIHPKAKADLAFSLFPNPAKTRLQLRGKDIKGALQYNIYDFQGRQVQKGNWKKDGIDIQSLPAGIYLLKLRDNTGRQAVRKWIKSDS